VRQALVLALLLALGTPRTALSEADGSAVDPSAPTALVVSVVEAEPQSSYPLEQVFVGRVEARRSAALGFERAGRLIEVRVREGDRVAADALLARLDTSILEAKRTELLADLASAEADLALAEATADRYRSSVKDGAVTRQNLDEASEGARAARARLQLAEARIASVDLDLTKTELRAPFAGTLIRRTADEGAVLNAGQAVLTLQETVAPEVRIGVAGPLLDALQEGERYTLDIDGETIHARLRAVIPLRTGASRTVDALFDPVEQPFDALGQPTEVGPVAAPDRTPEVAPELVRDPARASVLRPGNLAELRLSRDIEAQGFWIPLSALSEGERGLWRALVAEPETTDPQDAESNADASDTRWRLVSRPVQVLYVGRERVYVRGSLQAGDLIVTAGLHRLVPGQWVQLAGAGRDAVDRAR
jgi:RND family efflux transporter MFP subunit